MDRAALVDPSRIPRRSWSECSSLVLLGLVFLVHAAACAVLTPLGRGDDENDHLDYVMRLAYDPSLPDPRTERVGQIHHPPLAYFVQAALFRLGARVDQAWRDDGGRGRHEMDGDLFGRRTRFDPFGTRLDDLGKTASEFGDPAQYSVRTRDTHVVRHWVRYLLRGGSILLGLATLVLITMALREATGFRRGICALVVANLALTPAFVFTSAMINNDALVNFMVALVAYLGLRAWRRDRLRETGVVVRLGVVLGLALLAKVHAIGGAAFLFFLVATDTRIPRRRRFALAALLTLVAATVAGWWHVRQAVYVGGPASSSLNAAASPWLLRIEPLTGFGLVEMAGYVVKSFYAVFGQDRLETVLVYYVPAAGGVMVMMSGLSLVRRRDDEALHPPLLAAFLGVVVFIAAFLFANLFYYHVHGRYFFCCLVPIALGFVVGAHRLVGPNLGRLLVFGAAWNVGFTVFSVFGILANAYSIPLEKVRRDGVHAYYDCGSRQFDQNGAGGDRAVLRDGALSRPADTYRIAPQLGADPALRYDFAGLDPERVYQVRVRYPSLRHRGRGVPTPTAFAMLADDRLVHGAWSGWDSFGELVFTIPESVTRDGAVRIAWMSRTPATPVVACSEIWIETRTASPVDGRAPFDAAPAPYSSRKLAHVATTAVKATSVRLDVADREVFDLHRGGEPGTEIARLRYPDLTAGSWRLALTGGASRSVLEESLLEIELRDAAGVEIVMRRLDEEARSGHAVTHHDATVLTTLAFTMPDDGALDVLLRLGTTAPTSDDYLDRIVLRRVSK